MLTKGLFFQLLLGYIQQLLDMLCASNVVVCSNGSIADPSGTPFLIV